jgi:hypothetical protein
MDHPHWHYFLALCDDAVRSSRFVEFSVDNYRTYSIEFARLYLATGSEVDVVAKQLCLKFDSSSTAANINAYRTPILAKFPDLPSVKVNLPRRALSFTPWQEWAAGKNPTWWTGYNEVKHMRHVHFPKANLENMLNALAGLYVLVGYLYGDELAAHKLHPASTGLVCFEQKYNVGMIMMAESAFALPGIARPKR